MMMALFLILVGSERAVRERDSCALTLLWRSALYSEGLYYPAYYHRCRCHFRRVIRALRLTFGKGLVRWAVAGRVQYSKSCSAAYRARSTCA